MCGFVGFTRRGGLQPPADEVIKAMSSKIAHRGPDGEGHFITDAIALGFRRLSFLDLEHGEQPMHSADGTLTIVFNGEIYNFNQLREGLEAKGHAFKTTSDTEVLLALYIEHGAEMLNMLRGMFAFAIYDHRDDSIFAARDYFGIKPFYYGIFDDQLIFASEIKAMMPHPAFVKQINHAALGAYLSFQYSVLDETFFKGVFKLPAGHFMRYKDGEVKLTRYWQADFTPKDAPLDDIVNKIDDVMADSIAAHQVSDVEIGSFLSSGVDSSLIAACFNGKKTFTVGFDYAGYNEIDYAAELSAEKGLENHAKLITTEEYWQVLPKIQYHMDEPLADPAAVALYFVSQTARGHVKGVLSGEGADELFGGYNIYKEPLSLRPIRVLPRFIRRFLGKVAAKLPNFKGKNFLIRAAMDVEERFIGNAKIFSDDEKRSILKNVQGPTTQEVTRPYYDKIKHYDDITKMQYLDLHLWLVGDILLKADKMTMAHSLEGRVPLLDREVFAVAAQIPTKYRTNKKATKYAFRLAAARHLAPKWAEKRKLGFPVPIRVWLKQDDYYGIVKVALQSPAAQEFFNTEALTALLDAHKAGKADNSRKIWTVYMFLLWHKEFFAE
ncbi:MAG: asparagine synthase (glutamine-hydrolyzing) [Defluviitaleaceae bacterium]|nr:asparagine synthase (glutamine-hydrolyzing) [Defluviitaleaceae bacterium]